MRMICRATVAAVLLTSPRAALGQQEEPRHHRPSPEALAACEGQAAGASCSFTRHEHSIQGTCFTPDSSKPLACRPTGFRRHRQ